LPREVGSSSRKGYKHARHRGTLAGRKGGNTVGTKGKKKSDWPLVALVSVVAVLCVILFIYGPELFGGGPEFTVIVHYETEMDEGVLPGESGPGTIAVTGNITNVGTEAGTPVVRLSVFTGNATETFSVQAAPCPAGGHVAFEWSHHFSSIDRSRISIECDVELLET